jgi:hypothetical protein
MVDVSALFGASSTFGDIIAAKARIPSGVSGAQTAAKLKDTINDASRLDKDSKKTLTNLTDTVNQFAKGNSKLLRDIAAISGLMQFGGKEQSMVGDSPYAKLLSAYYAGKTELTVDFLS